MINEAALEAACRSYAESNKFSYERYKNAFEPSMRKAIEAYLAALSNVGKSE